jgi:hypothetical protein
MDSELAKICNCNASAMKAAAHESARLIAGITF